MNISVTLIYKTEGKRVEESRAPRGLFGDVPAVILLPFIWTLLNWLTNISLWQAGEYVFSSANLYVGNSNFQRVFIYHTYCFFGLGRGYVYPFYCNIYIHNNISLFLTIF